MVFDMDILIKSAVIGVVGAILALTVKKPSPETALVLTIAASALVVGFALEFIAGIQGIVDLATANTGLSPAVISPMLKCAGIGIITRLASDICSDAGAGGIASSVELAGAGAALYVALPLLQTLLQMIGGLI